MEQVVQRLSLQEVHFEIEYIKKNFINNFDSSTFCPSCVRFRNSIVTCPLLMLNVVIITGVMEPGSLEVIVGMAAGTDIHNNCKELYMDSYYAHCNAEIISISKMMVDLIPSC